MIQKITDIWRDVVVWRNEQPEQQEDDESVEQASQSVVKKNANWTRLVAMDSYEPSALSQWKVISDLLDTK